MRRRLPPLNALLAFESAARHGNFTRAAEELAVAQPAVTRHVANLEGWIGAPLFRRKGNSVSLTKSGELLSEISTAVFDRLELGLQGIPGTGSDEIVIGASFGITHMWLMPRITAMRSATRAVVNFVTSDDYSAFDTGMVDLSIRFGNGQFPGVEADSLFAEECFAIAAPSFLEAHPEIDPDDPAPSLRAEWLLDHGDPNSIGWITWPTWFEAMGAPFPGHQNRTQIRNYPTVLDMVASGEGIAIGSVGLDDALVSSGRIQRLGRPIARHGYGYYLVYHRRVMEKHAFAELRGALLKAGRGVLPRT